MNARINNREVKVCPLVLSSHGNDLDVLLFKHPLAGVQIVKGTLELTDESIESAALRELKEESGIAGVSNTQYLGSWESGYQNQLWHFVYCEMSEELPNEWAFFTQDDGGHNFSFFWHKLGSPIGLECHELFVKAIKHIEIMYL